MESLNLSIIICCYNSENRLPKTLNHLLNQQVPKGVSWEVVVVDNGSTDNTSKVALNTWGSISAIPLKILQQPNKGLSNARNMGIIHSSGNLVCFIDDDIRPAKTWLEKIYNYSTRHEAHAIVGKVILPEHLCRPWMAKLHRTRLASTENIDPNDPKELIGANMAIKRIVFEKIPMFDTELGAGAKGFGEETLFSCQLLKAGFSIGFCEDAIVEHHFDQNRLKRKEWISSAKKRGISKAYITHHWEHKKVDKPLKQCLRYLLRLYRWRLYHFTDLFKEEGCSVEELTWIKNISFFWWYLIEEKSPRKYEQYGLLRLE